MASERLNRDQILDAIAETLSSPELKIPQGARVEGARLAETWINEVEQFDSQHQTIAVEVPFFFFADKFTIVVGVQDRIARDVNGKVFGCEWKTSKGTTRYWNEEKWLEGIRRGHQIGIYGLAQKEGYFAGERFNRQITVEDFVVPELNAPSLFKLGIKLPTIMVRAITKENPPQIWPSEGQFFQEISKERMAATKNALIVRGAAIREARLGGLVPWQLPGLHCENRFSHTMCPMFEKYCSKYQTLSIEEAPGMIGRTDPGLAALLGAQSMLRVPLSDPRVVVLSASGYEAGNECLEKYRLEAAVGEDHYYQDEIDKGAALHAALSVFYGGTE